MKRTTHALAPVRAVVVALCAAFAAVAPAQQQGAARTPTTATMPTTARTQAQSQAQPEIDKQRQQAEQQAERALDRDAMSAIDETRNAVKAIEARHEDEARAAIERALGKLDFVLSRNPSAALVPVQAEVRVIDLAPTDPWAIREIAKAADRAVDERDYPRARVLLEGLISELRVRTYNIPLASYPAALREASRLLADQKRPDEARGVLGAALNSLVIVDRITPLPLVLAQTAIEQAQAERDRDKAAAQRDLAFAREELERARLLGYAGKDPEYDTLNREISDLERQLRGRGTENTTSAFARLKDRIAGFFKRHAGNENRADNTQK
jgi:hypothetical protein